MSARRVLLKAGGAALENKASIAAVCEAVRELRSRGTEVILVHGGGKSINRELERRQITWEFIEGQRKTTPEMMEVIEATLFGIVNRKLVRSLQKAGIPAAGLSGVDARTLLCTTADPRLGRVGTVDAVSTDLIQAVLGAGLVPVVAPIGVGSDGDAFNVNADWAASRLASALGVDALVFLTDQVGVLGADGKVLEELTVEGAEELMASQVIQGGMLAKMRAILDSVGKGVSRIRIAHANFASAAIRGESGTTLRSEAGSGWREVAVHV